MIKIGTYNFDVDEDREFLPKELAEILYDNKAEEIGEIVMDYNENDWGQIPFTCAPEIKGNMLYFHMSDMQSYDDEDEAPEADEYWRRFFETVPPVPVDQEIIDGLKNGVIRTSIVCNPQKMETRIFMYVGANWEVAHRDEYVGLFSNCFKELGIRTFSDLARAVKAATRIYKERIGAWDTPFMSIVGENAVIHVA